MLYRAILFGLLGATLAALGILTAYLLDQQQQTTSAAPVFSDGRGCTVYAFYHEGRRVYYADCTERMWR